MNARLLAPLLAMMLALVPTAGAAQCRLCAPGDREAVATPSRPLDITIETALDFSRVGGTHGGGSIAIDERSGRRAVAGLVDLGGFALKGTARVTGEPFRRIRIAMPASILLTSPEGGSAEAIGSPSNDTTAAASISGVSSWNNTVV